jgi:hypothetical protein
MNKPSVNIPLLRKAVEWAEASAAAEDGEWHQGAWVHFNQVVAEQLGAVVIAGSRHAIEKCGTAYCIAGYVGQLVDPAYEKSEWVGDTHVSIAAEMALGLTSEQADQLFRGSNTIEDIRRVAEEIAGGPL